MTFIQPHKQKNILNILLVALVMGLLVGTFWVIVSYNQTVSMSHDLAKAKASLDSIGAKSTSLNNDVIATLSGSQLAATAAADNLVEDKKPQYFRIDPNDLSLLDNR